MIFFACPECRENLEADDELRGARMRCPACWKEIEVPVVGAPSLRPRGAEARRRTRPDRGRARSGGRGTGRMGGRITGRMGGRGTKRTTGRSGGARGGGGYVDRRLAPEDRSATTTIAIALLVGMIALEVLVGIGMMASGGPEGSFVTCASCKGVGFFQCHKCTGSREVHCPTCGGTGTTLNWLDQKQTCVSCGGRRTITCPVCGGRGEYSCMTCRGTGLVRQQR